MAVVSYEVALALRQKSREIGPLSSPPFPPPLLPPPSYMSFWPANEGPRQTDGRRGGRSPSEGGGRRRRIDKTLHHSGISARGLGKTCCFGSDQKSSCHTFPADENLRHHPMFLYRHYTDNPAETAIRGRCLGPAVLIGPHGRSSWWVRFGGRACWCATEHLREVTPDEAGLLGPR